MWITTLVVGYLILSASAAFVFYCAAIIAAKETEQSEKATEDARLEPSGESPTAANQTSTNNALALTGKTSSGKVASQ